MATMKLCKRRKSTLLKPFNVMLIGSGVIPKVTEKSRCSTFLLTCGSPIRLKVDKYQDQELYDGLILINNSFFYQHLSIYSFFTIYNQDWAALVTPFTRWPKTRMKYCRSKIEMRQSIAVMLLPIKNSWLNNLEESGSSAAKDISPVVLQDP